MAIPRGCVPEAVARRVGVDSMGGVTSSDYWDEDAARRYDADSAGMFAPDVLDPAVAFLAKLAGAGPALEFGIGTGRVAIPLLERESGGKVEGLVGGPDPFDAVERAVREGDFDEIIVSTLPKQRSKWLRRDLIRRIEGLGLPVTAVIPKQKSIIEVLDDSISTRTR